MNSDERPYQVILHAPDGQVILTSNYYDGVSIPHDIADDLHMAYGKHRESRGLETSNYGENDDE